jgi:putative FmdB family regulatory protein
MIYEYRCPNCDYLKEDYYPIGKQPETIDCPQCLQQMKRKFSIPRFTGLNDINNARAKKEKRDLVNYEADNKVNDEKGRQLKKLDEEHHRDFAWVKNSGGRPAGYYPDE